MDTVDVKIVTALLDKERSPHELAKVLYPGSDDWELRKKASFLRYRLGRLAKDGLVRQTGRAYRVPLEEMIMGSAKLLVKNGSESFSLDFGKVLVTQDKTGDRQILVLG